ncbi:MAG TPA: isoprenylcysteine carboxylmethyltransferase family protein [Gallionella sp.]
MLKGVVFLAVTLALAWISRNSLRKPGSHGFYRFFAWEFMLGIFVLNMHAWYTEMDSPHKMIAGILFSSSLFLLLIGVGLLQLAGKPDTRRNDEPMLEFEKTTALVTTGIYRYIRHPLYDSLFLLCWGFFFKQPSLLGGVFASIASGFLLAAVHAEEAENIRYFGDAYREYMKRTKRFIPFIL